MALLLSLTSHVFSMQEGLLYIRGGALNVLQEGVVAEELYRDTESSVWRFRHLAPLSPFTGHAITSSDVNETEYELVEAYDSAQSREAREAWSDARTFANRLKESARTDGGLERLLAQTPNTPYHRYFLQEAGISAALGFAALKKKHAAQRRADDAEFDKELERQQLALAGVDYATNPEALQRLHETKLKSPTKKLKIRSALYRSGEPVPKLHFKENREGDEDVDFL